MRTTAPGAPADAVRRCALAGNAELHILGVDFMIWEEECQGQRSGRDNRFDACVSRKI